jgi:hypothetical protein
VKTWADILLARSATTKTGWRVWLFGVCIWLAMIVNVTARTAIDASDPVGFFTTVADKLLRNTFSFGVTNIPVETNGVFVYSPAVQRLLQLSANIYDATTTNFYPTVFRPVFNRDNFGNVFITGYERVVGVAGLADPQLATPIDISYLPTGISSNANVYGVPWIIGAKKYMPNFNEFYMFNTMQVTRELQVTRIKIEGYNSNTSSDFRTNQMFVMSLTNHIGFSFWNSYATNYPGGSPTIFVSDMARMVLTNGSIVLNFLFSTNFTTNLVTWLGSAWDTTQIPTARQAAPDSFISGIFDFPFVPASALQIDQTANFTGFIPLTLNPTFNPNVTSLPIFPQFGLITTNWFQAFILDGSNVIDYVQFSGPTSSQNLSAEIQDANFTGVIPLYMWSTNLTTAGLNWGVQNQLTVSRTDQNVPVPDSWIQPANMPPGLPHTIAAEASFFAGFFTPTFAYNGQVYVNTNLVILAPYTPTRTVVSPTIWVANDPLVHYVSSDLNETVNGLNVNGVVVYDDPLIAPFSALTPTLNVVADRYQPWGRNQQLASLNNVDQNAYNLAYKDPLVYGSDDWNFPSGNGLPLTTLGQIHRGTPWQTVYLKAPNILAETEVGDFGNLNSIGVNTWEIWTGDPDANDAALSAPVNDWRLAGLLAALFNTNDPTQLVSVNDNSPTDWLKILGGITVLTNSSPSPVGYYYAPQFDSYIMSSNSSQASVIANAISQTKTAQSILEFNSIGDILATPELTVISPWLNTSTSDQMDYGISDEAYETIPAQLLPLLRADSIGAIIQSGSNWDLQFSGSDGFAYALQTSTNLVNWEIVSTNCPQQGVYTVPLPITPDSPKHFYRSVLLH